MTQNCLGKQKPRPWSDTTQGHSHQGQGQRRHPGAHSPGSGAEETPRGTLTRVRGSGFPGGTHSLVRAAGAGRGGACACRRGARAVCGRHRQHFSNSMYNQEEREGHIQTYLHGNEDTFLINIHE